MNLDPIDVTQIIVALISFGGVIVSTYRPPPPSKKEGAKPSQKRVHTPLLMWTSVFLLTADTAVFIWRTWKLATEELPPPTQVVFYWQEDKTPFLTETGELCEVLKQNSNRVEIPELYFSKLTLPEGTIVSVENVGMNPAPSRELPIVIRRDVIKCVVGLSENYRAALDLPKNIGNPGAPSRYGHELRIILPKL